jgi:hypothetical protein
MLSDYSSHLRERVLELLERVSANERPDIYVVHLALAAAASDPRYRLVAVAANTEAHARASRERARDERARMAAGWAPEGFAHPCLGVLGDPLTDPPGAERWRAYATTALGGWEDAEGADPDDDAVWHLHSAFLGEVTRTARALHADGLAALLGRDAVTSIDTDVADDPLVLCNQQANPRPLPPDALAWYRVREEAG